MTLNQTIECDICGSKHTRATGDIRRLRINVAVGPSADGSPIIEIDYCSDHGRHRIGYYIFKRITWGDFSGTHRLIPKRWRDDE